MDEFVGAVAASHEPAVGALSIELTGRHAGLLRLRCGGDAVPICCDVVYVVDMCHVKTLAYLYRF